MNYKDVSRERLIEIIEEKDKLIQDLKSIKTELQYQAAMDCVTGVLNRRAGLDILEATINYATRQGENFILCFADIDDFKRINDEFGHNQGDKILTNIGNIFKENIRKTDTVFRFGGDEFVIIFPYTILEVAKSICSRINMKIHEMKEQDNSNYKIGLSYGFSEYNSNNNNISAIELIRRADEEMYGSKRLKK